MSFPQPMCPDGTAMSNSKWSFPRQLHVICKPWANFHSCVLLSASLPRSWFALSIKPTVASSLCQKKKKTRSTRCSRLSFWSELYSLRYAWATTAEWIVTFMFLVAFFFSPEQQYRIITIELCLVDVFCTRIDIMLCSGWWFCTSLQ